MLNKKSQILANAFSFTLSLLTSSHHWLHMGILFVLGGSTNIMATMSTFFWVRRLMILLTLITVGWSVYRLFKHRCRDKWIVTTTYISAILSIGFVLFTLYKFGLY